MKIETIADIRLVGRAMNEDWPVSSEVKSEAIEALRNILASGIPDLVIPASRALMAADGLNQKRKSAEEKKLDREHKRKLELIELAVKLGIVGNDSDSTRVLDSQQARGSDE